MPVGSADEPDDRRSLLVRAIVAHRSGGSGDVAGGDDESLRIEGAGRAVTYSDQTVRIEVDAAERERLRKLCADYLVFKVRQPETRKAPDGVVYLSAVTDAKHAADFLEDLFRQVFGAAADYALVVG